MMPIKKTTQPDYVLHFSEISKNDIPIAGGKGANLGEMFTAKIPVPDGFVVTSEAYYHFLDATKIGKKIKGLVVQSVSALPENVKKYNIKIGIIAVPAQASQQIADMLAAAGIRGILNFAPKTLASPQGVLIRTEDTTTPLETLTYYLSKARSSR